MKDQAVGVLQVHPVPFLKWAGGKSQLLDQFDDLYPRSFRNYFEPFAGAGAVFFELRSIRPIKKANLNDANKDLMNLWAAIKLKFTDLVAELHVLQRQTGDKDLFYQNRDEYNSIGLPEDFLSHPQVRKAALLVFLNKTCYNGLYRVNSRGSFNVPFGSYKKRPTLFSLANLTAVNKALQDHGKISITALDFEEAVRKAKKGDFVYFDPPYQPLTSTSHFTSYTKEGFGPEQQSRLAKVFASLDEKGCYVMLSNSQSRAFLEPLYEEYFRNNTFEVVRAVRAISSKGTGRGEIEELVVMNYEPPKRRQSRMDKF